MTLAVAFLFFAGYGPIRHYFPSLGRQPTDRAGARHGNLTPPRISPSCPHCLWLWLDRSIITRLLTRVGPDKPAAMRDGPPRAALWTDGYRCAPFLAVFDTDKHLYRWSWRILQRRFGSSQSLSSADVSPLPDLQFSRYRREGRPIDTPSTGQTGPGCCS